MVGFEMAERLADDPADVGPGAKPQAPVGRPLLRWHGGKWMLAPWVASHFPAHRIYTEAYGGAASVLLRKARSFVEIYNDLDGDVVTLFRVLRSPRATELCGALRLTPYAREEFDLAYVRSDDEVERARRLVVRSFLGFGSNAHFKRSGFRYNSNVSGTAPARSWANYPDHLQAIVDRVAGVVVENRDALDVLRANDTPETLHYVDPPYLPGTRDTGRDYHHEMDVPAHRRLIETLRGLGGMVVLSGYPSAVYDDALAGWAAVTRQARADGARPRTECLWLNPACADALGRLPGVAAVSLPAEARAVDCAPA